MTPSLQPATVQAKLRLMQSLLEDMAKVRDVTEERLLGDRMLLYAVEHMLTQVVELASSVNAHIAAGVSGRAPASYRESFDDVARLDVLPDSLAEALKPSVGMRNVLVHEYATVDVGRVAAAVPEALEQYAEYVRHVARWLLKRTDGEGREI